MLHGILKSYAEEDVCVLVKADNHSWNYMVDCGAASELTDRDCARTKALFVSHTHIDHFCNFDKVLRNQLYTGNQLIVTGPPGILKNVEGRLNSFTWNLIPKGSFSIEVRELAPDLTSTSYLLEPPNWEAQVLLEHVKGSLFELGKIEVTCSILDHGIPSVAYLFTEGPGLKIKSGEFPDGPWITNLKKAYQANEPNRKIRVADKEVLAAELFHLLYQKPAYRLAVIMDHLCSKENHERILDLCQGVDHLFIESHYKHVDYELALSNFHSTAQASGEIARMAGVKEVTFIHRSKRYSGFYEELEEEGRRAFSGIS